MTLNARGRMATVTRAGQAVAEYGYDIHQLRVSKTLGDGTIIHYHYDDQGRMISETDGTTGAIIREYIWFGLSPVAVTGVGGLHFIHTDHLGKQTFVTDTFGTSVWDGGITTPFGVSLNTVGAFTQRLMFPGQYEDEETGYDQNWNRTSRFCVSQITDTENGQVEPNFRDIIYAKFAKSGTRAVSAE